MLHLQKLCVGVNDPAHLLSLQQRWFPILETRFGPGRVGHVTRMMPKRAGELLAGGSLYWVIRGVMCVRQRLAAIEPWSRNATPFAEEEGAGEGAATLLVLDAAHVAVQGRPCRAFQGWRYLAEDAAPPDLSTSAGGDEMPAALRAELGRLGLL